MWGVLLAEPPPPEHEPNGAVANRLVEVRQFLRVVRTTTLRSHISHMIAIPYDAAEVWDGGGIACVPKHIAYWQLKLHEFVGLIKKISNCKNCIVQSVEIWQRLSVMDGYIDHASLLVFHIYRPSLYINRIARNLIGCDHCKPIYIYCFDLIHIYTAKNAQTTTGCSLQRRCAVNVINSSRFRI